VARREEKPVRVARPRQGHHQAPVLRSVPRPTSTKHESNRAGLRAFLLPNIRDPDQPEVVGKILLIFPTYLIYLVAICMKN